MKSCDNCERILEQSLIPVVVPTDIDLHLDFCIECYEDLKVHGVYKRDE